MTLYLDHFDKKADVTYSGERVEFLSDVLISERLFCALPSSVELVAIGKLSP